MTTYRYKLIIEYDGTPFHGFQYQIGLSSVQGELEKALSVLNNKKLPKIYVAGRTDAGVHATAQVAHVDLETNYEDFNVMQAVNQQLRKNLRPQTISVIKAQHVEKEFHARFSAKKRFYIYKIINRHSPSPLNINKAWHVYPTLNTDSMNKAAKILEGHHDFTSFRSVECQSSNPTKTLDKLSVYKTNDLITIEAVSQSFLHHQVRNIVGTLKLVGEEKWSSKDVKEALEAKDRRAAGPTAPASGLYLTKIEY